MSTTKIIVSAEINAPIQEVWECNSNPKHIVNWNFAHPSWHCPYAENDFKVGGKYLATMAAKDGSFSFDFEAIHDEIIPNQKIRYTMLDGRKVCLTFIEKEKGVILEIEFDAEGNNPIEMQQQGWQSILNNFKTYTEKIAIQ